jgi:hypothetical protein
MPTHKWTFKSHFRANAYGWKGTALASKRLKEAISEIKKVAKSDPITAADGAVSLMERIWPALQGIDGSSGALGNAVDRTLETVIPFVIEARANKKVRSKWLERLYEAVQEDGVDYLTPAEDSWGAICGDADLAGEWVDRLLPLLKESWSREDLGGWVKGASLCLSCLVATGRYDELQQLLSLRSFRFWSFDKFWARALIDQQQIDAAIEFAKSCRKDQPSYDDEAIVAFCEQTLLDAGRADEAYERYAMQSGRASTNLATFRQIAKKYLNRDPRKILRDLIETQPPKGKWFAAAKDAGCTDVALECAADGWAEPATLIRAARDFTENDADFAAKVALCAIRNLLAGGGYEPTTLDMIQAHQHLINAAVSSGRSEWAAAEVDRLIDRGTSSDRQALLKVLVEERSRQS